MELSEFVKQLVCPETHQPLRLADARTIESLNALIAKGHLKNRSDRVVSEKLDAGLLREDGKWVYPVRGNLPVMLIDEAVTGL